MSQPDLSDLDDAKEEENFGNIEIEKEENLLDVKKLMMAGAAKLNFECACVIEKVIASVVNHEDRYKWLLERLFKSLNPEFNSSGKIDQLREWLNFSSQQKTHDDLEMLKLFLDAVIMIESKKKE